MENAMDYIRWRGDLSFDSAPFNDVDCFICSQLSTPDYSGIADRESVTLAEAAERYFLHHTEDKSNLGVLQSVHVLPMLRSLSESPRYRDIVLEGYENKINEESREQFCAVTVRLPDGTMVISYRGTDDTIVGWNEDFNIAINEPVPAQSDAVDYLVRHGSGFCGDIVLTGHSKGGNLAVYAAVNAPISLRGKIRSAVSFDGPGFRREFLESDAYRAAEPILRTILPQHSLVGVILGGAGQRVIVSSTVSGPMSHDGFNWQVTRDGFVSEPTLAATSEAYSQALNQLIDGMEQEEMQAFINELFTVLNSTEADTLTELRSLKPAALLELVNRLLRGKHINSFTTGFLEKFIKAML